MGFIKPEIGMKGYIICEDSYLPVTIIKVDSLNENVLVKINVVRYIYHDKVNIADPFDFDCYDENDYEIYEKDNCRYAIMKNEYEDHPKKKFHYYGDDIWFNMNGEQLILNEWKYDYEW